MYRKNEAVVVAECLRQDSPYDRSTIGYIVREEDEPAVFRIFQYGVATDAVEAKVFQKDEFRGNMIQWVKPIINGEAVIGVLIFEHQNVSNTEQRNKNKASYTDMYDFWLADYLDEGILFIDSQGLIRYRNKAAYQIFRQQGYLVSIRDITRQRQKEQELITKVYCYSGDSS